MSGLSWLGLRRDYLRVWGGTRAKGDGCNGLASWGCCICAAGTFSDVIDAETCTAADAGHYVAEPGSTEQTACESGTFQPEPGKSSCLDCPVSFATGATFCGDNPNAQACISNAQARDYLQSACAAGVGNGAISLQGASARRIAPVETAELNVVPIAIVALANIAYYLELAAFMSARPMANVVDIAIMMVRRISATTFVRIAIRRRHYRSRPKQPSKSRRDALCMSGLQLRASSFGTGNPEHKNKQNASTSTSADLSKLK